MPERLNEGMSAETKLFEALRKWRRLTESEGQSLRQRNWAAVLECQNGLKRLQSELTPQVLAAQANWARAGADGGPERGAFQSAIAEIVGLQKQNQSWLEEHRRLLAGRLQELETKSRNLRRVRSSYAAPAPAVWSSLS